MLKYVINTVDDIGVPKHLKGYEAIVKAVEYKCKAPELGICVIYQCVALDTGKSAGQIERNIRHAIRWLLIHCDNERIRNYFGNSYRNDGKITNKQFIDTLAVISTRLYRRAENVDDGR